MHETALRLMTAAEELLRERGQAATSLRDVTERAGTNVAAVSYHFRSKDALFAQVYGRALDEVTARQRERLRSLASSASLREVVEVWLGPALHPEDHDEREMALWLLIARGSRERAPALISHVATAPGPDDDELVRLLAERLPHLTRREVTLRHSATIAAFSALFADGPDGEVELRAPDPMTREMLLDWVVAGLSGPGRKRTAAPARPGRARAQR